MFDFDCYQVEDVELTANCKAALDSLQIPPDCHITVHMVHLNHLDLTWYWCLPDTIEMCLETIRWHVALLERCPDMTYSHTQVFTLKVVEQLDYPLFCRFAELVKQGRIELDSGQMVEPDHNIPSGESLAHQFLYGQSFLQSRFGRRAVSLVNSDSFGHTRSLPQIMRLSGIRYMIFKRPRQKFVDLPETPFLWKGIDGTTIPALRFINKGAGLPSLSQYYDLPEGTSELQEKVNRNLAVGVSHFFGSHCASDAGGVTPYVRPVEADKYSLRYSTPTAFFEAVLSESPNLPVVERPLNHVYQGCYTTHIAEKENCRRAERELRGVEFLWVIASLLGYGYPENITSCWLRLCYLQFHDILPGTGSPEAHSDSRAHYYELFLTTNLLRRKAQIMLDGFCPAYPSIRSFLVANPRPFPSGGVACADVEMPVLRDKHDSHWIPDVGFLRDDCGNQVPYQIVEKRVYQRYVRGTMLFSSPSVPALDLKSFYLVLDSEEPLPFEVSASGGVIRNEFLEVEVGGPGIIRTIRSIRDDRQCLISSEAPVAIELWPETDYPGDYGTPMKAWMLGTTEHREDAQQVGEPVIIENGPVRATVRTQHSWGSSLFTTDVSLYAGQDWVEIRIEMDWREKEVLARLRVEPVLFGNPRCIYGIPFGSEVASVTDLELPSIGWACIYGDTGGIAVLNRDRPGHTFRDSMIRVSLVRCATGNHDPCTDSGIIRTTLRILPFATSVEEACIPLRSDEFNFPLIAWQVEPSERRILLSKEPIRLKGEGIILSSLKLAERRDAYVLRLYESLGRFSSAVLTLGPQLAYCDVFESNILEDDIKLLPVLASDIHLDFAPFEIKTLLIKLVEPVAVIPGPFAGTIFSP